ncbi:hypothetical protein ABB30_01005 [Stenotrophomonas ginsengisoli]|uniref:Lipoprotein n=1 Tax=Stenotrophomonas ginsengisoli TaxID=336566 RepID=A0A0R0DAM1_9GAMM|nr:hypothetical protein [Stenotrophomonas ginsengisoli]KRG79388.1 hypothetical protein ABB30_01005 [Stenotrophomonas ginsengisoli]
MNKNLLTLASAALALSLAACADNTSAPATGTAAPAAAGAASRAAAPADAFLAALASECGKAFAGRIVANEPATGQPDAFEGKALIMHVRGCDKPAEELRVPFHVGDDHSRTWVITRTDGGLRLKHDHRHSDGSEDVQTMYGGDSVAAGTAIRQEFPVDAYSIELFEREGLQQSTSNSWAMEIEPGKRFLYELSRPSGRLFQVEFDLSQPVALPPAPWGAQD